MLKQMKYIQTNETYTDTIIITANVKNDKYDNRKYQGLGNFSLYKTPANISRLSWHNHYLEDLIFLYKKMQILMKKRHPYEHIKWNNKIFNNFSRFIYKSSSKYLL